ncbi:PilZ domain-containing protein [Dongshaea marina]|uniref:PilZ domain-containing protein n=1 Tax=Dongshaea marina TaxID=2047966 RepID=UPI000D3ECB7C|nr:PilZ domain-containing protein [Dongshaea marina]
MAERRMFSRVVYKAQAHISQNGQEWETELRDLSLRGALTDAPDNWTPTDDDQYVLRFNLDHSDIELTMQVQLRHIEPHRLGFLCHHIDIDSASHLRRLIELNVGNDELLHRELEHLIEDEISN